MKGQLDLQNQSDIELSRKIDKYKNSFLINNSEIINNFVFGNFQNENDAENRIGVLVNSIFKKESDPLQVLGSILAYTNCFNEAILDGEEGRKKNNLVQDFFVKATYRSYQLHLNGTKALVPKNFLNKMDRSPFYLNFFGCLAVAMFILRLDRKNNQLKKRLELLLYLMVIGIAIANFSKRNLPSLRAFLIKNLWKTKKPLVIEEPKKALSIQNR